MGSKDIIGDHQWGARKLKASTNESQDVISEHQWEAKVHFLPLANAWIFPLGLKCKNLLEQAPITS